MLTIIEASKMKSIFEGQTDCNTFVMIMTKRSVPLRVSRWVMSIQQFDFIIEHGLDSQMIYVDPL